MLAAHEVGAKRPGAGGDALGPAGSAPVGAGPRGPVRSEEGLEAGRGFDFQTSVSPRAPEKAAFPSYQACWCPPGPPT